MSAVKNINVIERMSGRFAALVLLWLITVTVQAQQQFQLTQYMLNPYLLNPAAAGTEADLDIRTGARQQWRGFPGSPKTYYLCGNARIKVLKKPDPACKNISFHSIGGSVYKDEAGPIKRFSGLVSYGYNIPLSSNLNMSLGLSAGFLKVYLDYSSLNFDQSGETPQYTNKTLPDANVGTWIYNKNFYFGFSANQLFMNEINLVKDQVKKDDASSLVHHYYITNGYNIPLGFAKGKESHSYYLVPSFIIRYSGVNKPSVDLNVKIKMKDLLWLGTSFRHGDAVSFLAGIKVLSTEQHRIDMGYSYDHTTSALSNGSLGSHEIILIYKMTGKTGILCPRNFW